MKHSQSKTHVEQFLRHLSPPLDPAPLLQRLETFVQILLKHAERRDLLSASQRNPAAAWSHVLDCLQPLAFPSLAEAEWLIDAGSGGGLPGIPLAIALPGAKVQLVERSSSKAEFLELAKGLVPLTNVEIKTRELEESIGAAPANSIFVARALAQPAKWKDLLRKSESIPSWIIFATAHNQLEWTEAAEACGLSLTATHAYVLPESPGNRILLQFSPH